MPIEPLRSEDDGALGTDGSNADVPPTADYPVPLPSVTLVQTEGPLKGRRFVFKTAGTTVAGRDEGCCPDFPKDSVHKAISRHHCLFDINPPEIRVRDLGSTGGTYVNGKLIGKKLGAESGAKKKDDSFPECDLHDGDTLTLGKQGSASFVVRVFKPVACAKCGFPLPETALGATATATKCGRCGTTCAVPTESLRHHCTQCGRDVSGEPGANRQGAYTCSQCRERLVSVAPSTEGPTLKGFTILKLLGQGGMGSVWLGRKEDTQEMTAVKVMLPSVAVDQRSAMRFFQEIEITRALRHENLVRLIKAGYHQNTFYLALEYCDRGSVAQLIEDRNAPLRIDEAVEITRQALDGLHYAHSQFRIGKPLIHRDIKPANILLAGSGGKLVARIADYGLAKALDDSGLSGLTRTGDRAGTPIFMPRQQVLHFKHPTTDFDVWAMAASLYYMLTMSPPRTFSKQKDRWTTVLEADPVPIRIRRADLPRRLADAIDHALTERPAIGFKTAAEFKDALDGTA